MPNSDVSATLANAGSFTESLRKWNSEAVLAQLDALDSYLRNDMCVLGRTPLELLLVFSGSYLKALAMIAVALVLLGFAERQRQRRRAEQLATVGRCNLDPSQLERTTRSQTLVLKRITVVSI